MATQLLQVPNRETVLSRLEEARKPQTPYTLLREHITSYSCCWVIYHDDASGRDVCMCFDPDDTTNGRDMSICFGPNDAG